MSCASEPVPEPAAKVHVEEGTLEQAHAVDELPVNGPVLAEPSEPTQLDCLNEKMIEMSERQDQLSDEIGIAVSLIRGLSSKLEPELKRTTERTKDTSAKLADVVVLAGQLVEAVNRLRDDLLNPGHVTPVTRAR